MYLVWIRKSALDNQIEFLGTLPLAVKHYIPKNA